jgi:hypothetical protein
MMKTGILVLFCVLAAGVGTAAFAKATKVAAVHDVRHVPSWMRVTPMADGCRHCSVVRQDLFDRNNPDNLRSDYPSPPAQPAQF